MVSSDKHCQNMLENEVTNNRSKHKNFSKSCCDNGGACGSDCHIAVTISLFMSPVVYSTALLSAMTFESFSSPLLVRELMPPSRPPLLLS